tara:strand:+ start:1063 stop:1197 length:135 start_codon:yes stop_codon:yes gene_type:complete
MSDASSLQKKASYLVMELKTEKENLYFQKEVLILSEKGSEGLSS